MGSGHAVQNTHAAGVGVRWVGWHGKVVGWWGVSNGRRHVAGKEQCEIRGRHVAKKRATACPPRKGAVTPAEGTAR